MKTELFKLPGKTLVIGSEGFIGKSFLKAYRQFYPDAIGTDYKSQDISMRLDLYSPSLDSLNLKKNEYEYALIAAANTNLILCEQEKNCSFRRNVEGVLLLARELVRREIRPILFSTSYVFDGEVGGYDEASRMNPINEYGRQKAIIDREIPLLCGDEYLIVRTSKVFDLIKGGDTLIDEMCSRLLQNNPVYAAYDQVFSPILLSDLVQAVL